MLNELVHRFEFVRKLSEIVDLVNDKKALRGNLCKDCNCGMEK